jgi:hypothetical protein
MAFLLDTDVAIHLRDGDPAVAEKVSALEDAVLLSIGWNLTAASIAISPIAKSGASAWTRSSERCRRLPSTTRLRSTTGFAPQAVATPGLTGPNDERILLSTG